MCKLFFLFSMILTGLRIPGRNVVEGDGVDRSQRETGQVPDTALRRRAS